MIRCHTHRRPSLVALLFAVLLLQGCADHGGSEEAVPTTVAGLRPADGPTGSTWTLTSYYQDDAEVATVPVAPTLRFGDDGTLDGSTGCTSFTGTWSGDGSDLRPQLGEMSRRECASPAQGYQEAAVLDALAETTRQEVHGDTLLLFEEDEALLRYETSPARAAGI